VPVRRFTSRQVTVEAVLWTGTNLAELAEFTGPGIVKIDRTGAWLHNSEERAYIPLPTGHWVIRGILSEFYPCSPAALEAKYDPAGEPACAP
jgi:hypothetical protein